MRQDVRTQSLKVTKKNSIRQREMRLLGDYFDICETLGEGGCRVVGVFLNQGRCKIKDFFCAFCQI